MTFSDDEKQLIRRTMCPSAHDDEFDRFMRQCERTGLDPFAKQIYPVMRWDSNEGRKVLETQVSIHGFRTLAERTARYAGQKGPFWCGRDGTWVEVWLKGSDPAAAKVGILRTDFDEPLWSVARWEDYVQTTSNGQPSFMWQKMGPHMLAKCAESNGLRRAFPDQTGGLYTKEEMGQATTPDSDEDGDSGPETDAQGNRTQPPPTQSAPDSPHPAAQSEPSNPDLVEFMGYEIAESLHKTIKQFHQRLQTFDDPAVLRDKCDEWESWFQNQKKIGENGRSAVAAFFDDWRQTADELVPEDTGTADASGEPPTDGSTANGEPDTGAPPESKQWDHTDYVNPDGSLAMTEIPGVLQGILQQHDIETYEQFAAHRGQWQELDGIGSKRAGDLDTLHQQMVPGDATPQDLFDEGDLPGNMG